jgi:beta-lactamase superfamily II metal-dependent hydrolase
VKKSGTLFVFVLLLIFIVFLAVRLYSPPGEENGTDGYGTMEVFVFGIGRADAILITTPNHAVMIDTGGNPHGEYLLNRLTELEIEQLDYLIITHFDSDHVGGAFTIINNVKIGEVILPNYSRESRHVERMETALKDMGLTPTILKNPLYLFLDCADFIIDPTKLDYVRFGFNNDNDDDCYDDEDIQGDNFSIVVSISHGYNHFLFTGDAQNFRMGEILENETLMAVEYTFVKLPRHGRFTRNAIDFIHTTRPRYAVITGFHPNNLDIYYPERPTDERILTALEYAGTEVFFTMSEGVRVVSTGEGVWVKDIP